MLAAPLRILVLGAHPDDAEFHAGALIAAHAAQGSVVKLVSVTDGRSGHFDTQASTADMTSRRRAEAAAAGAVIGAEYVTWEFPDGSLVPSLELRWAIVREIRTFAPDLLLTHRPCDYHPDHRAVGQAVQDASYLVTVPRVLPEVAPLFRDPVVASMVDLFTRPQSLRADVVRDAGPHFETIVRMLAAHESQVFEWLAYEDGQLADVPPASDPEGRLAWLGTWVDDKLAPRANVFRDALIATYGDEQGRAIRYCEAYEISEYARQPTPEEVASLFPV
jgi:N-acetylglucosamine malate deacetylase 1